MMLKKMNKLLAVGLLIGNHAMTEAYLSQGVVTPFRQTMYSPSCQSLTFLKSSAENTSGSTRRPKKSVQDRTQEEALNLIRDMVQAAVESGPRAGPARTFQAYMAVTRTLQDFSPLRGNQAEQFSAPVALRKLFERLGATYIKLGQFVASSPSLFPKEYVLEFQKCLDATEPLEWKVIKKVIEDDLGKN